MKPIFFPSPPCGSDLCKKIRTRLGHAWAPLKVPKCEIFDRSDFPDFYTIKSSWVGDLVVKILTYYFLLFEGAKPHLVSDAHAKHTHKELMRMLSMCISSWRVCSAWFVGTSFKFGIFMLMLSICLRNWCACWAYASGTDAHAEHTRQELMCMLSIRISSWPVCSGYASVPGAYAQHFLKGMRSVHALVPDAYAQCTHQFLTHMLSLLTLTNGLKSFRGKTFFLSKLKKNPPGIRLSIRLRNFAAPNEPLNIKKLIF